MDILTEIAKIQDLDELTKINRFVVAKVKNLRKGENITLQMKFTNGTIVEFKTKTGKWGGIVLSNRGSAKALVLGKSQFGLEQHWRVPYTMLTKVK